MACRRLSFSRCVCQHMLSVINVIAAVVALSELLLSGSLVVGRPRCSCFFVFPLPGAPPLWRASPVPLPFRPLLPRAWLEAATVSAECPAEYLLAQVPCWQSICWHSIGRVRLPRECSAEYLLAQVPCWPHASADLVLVVSCPLVAGLPRSRSPLQVKSVAPAMAQPQARPFLSRASPIWGPRLTAQ